MLFDNNIEPSCSYCRYGSAIGRNEYACEKHGIMFGYGFCGAFLYEPTKRIPTALPSLNSFGLSDEDFVL